MWFSSDHKGVCVFVRGDFAAPGLWLIRATVSRQAGAPAPTEDDLLQPTVRELWRGIAAEGRVGRRLGASVMRVIVDGETEVQHLLAMPRRKKTSAPAISASASV